MSSQNINISPKNVVGKCDLKCSYSFKYSESNSTAKNNGVMISLTYDAKTVAPVIYNNNKYNVSNISIVSPSIHLFNNQRLQGEIIIEHTPVNGGNTLSVCVPFVKSSDSSSATELLTEIIQTVASNAPSDGESTNLNISGFNLQKIVPRKPFFSYSSSQTDYIVFGALEAIPLSSSTLSTLQKIITPYNIATEGGDLFYNSKGPVSGIQIKDGLYISCKPTGSSDEETGVIVDSKSTSSINFSELFNSKGFQLFLMILFGCILFILVFYGISAFYGYLTKESLNTALI